MLDAADGEWKRAAAVREGDAQLRKALEDAAENHRANRERSFGRHADEPRQPVFRHALLAKHVPWMNEDRSVELLGRAPDRLQRCVIEIQRIDAAEMLVRVDVGADLRAAQAEVAHATLQLAARPDPDLAAGSWPSPAKRFG